MNEGFERKLMLISAPAGFGKTTLLADWVHRNKIPVAWFSVDKNDNDPVHFLTYIILVLQSLEAGIGKTAMMMLQSNEPPSIESVLINLINDVTCIPKDVALIFDDYHLADTKPIHVLIAFLLDNLPEQVHIIIATRSDPPLPLARLRSQHMLIELRAADLSFSADEASDFFNQDQKLQLSSYDVQLLETRTEGWIAGMQLAALSLQGCKDPSQFIKAFKGDNRYIADYLTEELLDRQSENMYNFLLQTSILGRMCGPLCDAVTLKENSQQTLEILEKANMFAVPLDNERRWYRYHHLFSDLLEQRLHRYSGDLVPELHDRASQWYEENDFMVEALDHAFSAGNFKRSVVLLNEIAETVWERGEHTKLRRWLNGLPDELVCGYQQLCIFSAYLMYMDGKLEAAELRLQEAERILIDRDSVQGSYPERQNPTDQRNNLNQKGMIATIRSYIAAFGGEIDATVRLAEEAIEYLSEGNPSWRCRAEIALGDAHFSAGNMTAASIAYAKVANISRKFDDRFLYLTASLKLATSMFYQGRLQQVIDFCHQTLELFNENTSGLTAKFGAWYALWGYILCERNDLQNAKQYVNKGIVLCEQGNVVYLTAWSYISSLRVLYALGDWPGIKKTVRKLNELDRNFNAPVWIPDPAVAWKARILIKQNKLKEAEKVLRYLKLNSSDKYIYLYEDEYVVKLRLLIAFGRHEDSIRLLDRLLKEAEAGGRMGKAIELLILRALLYHAHGDVARAMATLGNALILAESENYDRVFIDEGLPMLKLLTKLIDTKKRDLGDAQADFSFSYAQKILSIFKAGTPAKTDRLMDPISGRELEVLHLIATGLSNREIAENLFISLNTVKTHTKNINSKLNVNNRTKAVARAKQLGLM